MIWNDYKFDNGMDRLRNICMAAAAMLACCTAALAQGGYVVSGTVEDQLGPVIGATVMEQVL